MYEYRAMTPEQRKAAIEERERRGYPWHRPPHPETAGQYRIVTGTCFEHRKHLNDRERLEWFENELLEKLKAMGRPCAAWVVLPNHYHVLPEIEDFRGFNAKMGQLHGKTSFVINGEDHARGRQVWYKCQDRVMRSRAHSYTSLNYIHHNPVKHGYVKKWQDWPFSSAHWYLLTKGRDWVLKLWRDYPLKGYGEKWDRS